LSVSVSGCFLLLFDAFESSGPQGSKAHELAGIRALASLSLRLVERLECECSKREVMCALCDIRIGMIGMVKRRTGVDRHYARSCAQSVLHAGRPCILVQGRQLVRLISQDHSPMITQFSFRAQVRKQCCVEVPLPTNGPIEGFHPCMETLEVNRARQVRTRYDIANEPQR
jgi:hypothetical protein